MEDKKLQWHPAFQAALQIELEEDREFLEFQEEYNLNKKPLQIDTLVISMKPGGSIRKTIGRIFRRYNVVEYKNPKAYINMNDFHKVMAYACLYQANTKKVREIPPEEYVWLSRLRDDLTVEKDIESLSRAYKGKDHAPLYSAAMEFIVRANRKEYEEGLDVCQALEELFEGKLNEREARGEVKAAVSQIRKKFNKHSTSSQAAEALELEEPFVGLVMEKIRENPDMDDVAIAAEMLKNRIQTEAK